jgi:hypothetical protein
MTTDDADADDVGPWYGGSQVRVDLPGNDATVTGRVHGSTGHGRTRVLVDGPGDEKDTEILVPAERIVAVVEQ